MTLEEYIHAREGSSPREGAKLELADAQFERIGSLVARRLEAGLTVGQLAERSGVDAAEIAEIEGGRLSPAEAALEHLQTALHHRAELGDV